MRNIYEIRAIRKIRGSPCSEILNHEFHEFHELTRIKRNVDDLMLCCVCRHPIVNDLVAVRLRIVEFDEAARIQISNALPPRASSTSSLKGLPGAEHGF